MVPYKSVRALEKPQIVQCTRKSLIAASSYHNSQDSTGTSLATGHIEGDLCRAKITCLSYN